MTERFNMEEIEKEAWDIILNSKSRRTTVFEPCNKDNIVECLKSIKEEFSIQGINYIYDSELEKEVMNSNHSVILIDTLVRLINACWNLLRQHKEVANNADKLKDRNYALQQNNFYLNNLVEQLKNDLKTGESKIRQAEESKRQVIHKFDLMQKELLKANEDLKRCKKQMISKEDQLSKQIKKIERDYVQFQDRTRRSTGTFVSRNEVNNLYIEEFKLKEKKYKDTILKLQEANKHLLREVVNLKDDLISSDKDEFE